jgi:hypothetical protein
MQSVILSGVSAISLVSMAGAQSCFEPHDDPGCDDANCQKLVCAEDFFCCEASWDANCVEIAEDVCGGGGGDGLDCDSAVEIGLGDHDFDTSSSSSNLDLTGYCDPGDFGDDIIYRSIWFKWTCPSTDGYVFSTCNQASFDTRIAIFADECNTATIVDCLDDSDDCGGYTTRLGISATAGTEYFICIGGFANVSAGPGTLTVEPAIRELVRVLTWPEDLGAPEDTVYEAWRPSAGTTNWEGCRADAEANGDQLASVSSAEENLLVSGVLSGFGTGYQAFGLFQDLTASDYAEPLGAWVFTDGTPLTYTNWGSGEPNNSGNLEHSAQIGFGGIWNDIDGTDESAWTGYAVKRPSAPFRYLWESADGGNGHEYEAFALPVSMNIVQAHLYAESRGGYLVAINSVEEMDMLIERVIPQCWTDFSIAIGLVQDTGASDYVEPGGGWVWSSGEPVEYTNWNTGEPNDNPVGEDFGEMYGNGRWNDLLPSSNALAVIIEYGDPVEECLGDLTGDGQVDGADLTQLLGAWGTTDPEFDLDDSALVDGGDLTILLGAWGLCS